MAEKSKPDPSTELHRTLNNACRKWSAREIRLRYLPKPSINRWIAEALIDHHRVIEKIRADIPAGELTLQDMETFNDQPIARGLGDTATDAIKNHVALAMESAETWLGQFIRRPQAAGTGTATGRGSGRETLALLGSSR